MNTLQKLHIPFPLLIIFLACLSAFGSLSIDMYLPALPNISSALNAPLSMIQLSLSSFFIGLAVGQVFYGPLSDRFGRKKPLYIGLTIYAVASVGCALTPNAELLIFFRFLQALGSCAGQVVSRAVVRDIFTKQETARIFSLLLLVMGVAPILAPLIGGVITEVWGWRAIFATLAVFSASCLIILTAFLPETHPGNKEIKLNKIFSMYKQILLNRTFLGYALAGGAAQAGMFSYITGSSEVFIEIFDIAPKDFGWIFGMNAVGLIIFSQINAKLVGKMSIEKVLNLSFLIIALSALWLGAVPFFETSLVGLMIPLFIFISILGMTFPNSTAGAISAVDINTGTASALLGTIQYGISAIASSMVSKLHDGSLFPMCISMASCGIIAFVLHRVLIKQAL